jgi:hypothetical protein
MSMWGTEVAPARHRRPDPVAVVTLVFADLTEVKLAQESALARSIGRVADLLVRPD